MEASSEGSRYALMSFSDAVSSPRTVLEIRENPKMTENRMMMIMIARTDTL